MFYRAKFAVCSEINTKHVNTLWTECTVEIYAEIKCQLPYILEYNAHPFYSFRGPKSWMRIRFVRVLDSRSRAGFWKNDTAAVHAIRTIQYNHLLSYLLL